MRRSAKRSSIPTRPGVGDAALPAKEMAAPKERKPEAKKKKEAVDLSEDDIFFIAEETYQRKQRKWSQEKMAEMVGVTRSAIQLIEAWQRGLSLRLAGAIARVHASTTGYFIEAGREKNICLNLRAFSLRCQKAAERYATMVAVTFAGEKSRWRP